jgi:hypothetical protein
MNELSRFEAKVWHEPASGCWLWTGALYWDGYGAFCMNGKQIRAHHAGWRLFRGDIPDGLWVLHHCDVPACVNPDHLFLGTHQRNMDDAVSKGRQARGRRVKAARLTEAAVISIREKCRTTNATNDELAAEFGVCAETVRLAMYGQTWKHVAGALPLEMQQSRQTRAHGARAGSAKLTTDQVVEIRAQLAEGREGCTLIGRRFGVSKTAIQRIRQGRSWAQA